MATNPDGSDTFHAIPGGAEIWENTYDGYWYAVYRVPGTGTPLAYKIPNHQTLTAIFGPGADWKPDKVTSWGPINVWGVIDAGTTTELANTSQHPFDAFVDSFQTEANVKPYLRDPQIQALTIQALLEGRDITPGELASTDWWKTHNDAERRWIELDASDPKTAGQKINDARVQAQQLLGQLGIANAPKSLTDWLADRVTSGTWTQAYQQSQISKLADPYSPGDLDPALAQQAGGLGLASQKDNTSKVDSLLHQWVGPVAASGWTQQMKDDAAGRLRNDPSGAAEDALVKQLQQQRLALLPEYDPSLSYDAIAANWRGVYQQTMGQPANETDPIFQQMLRVGSSPPSKDGTTGVVGVQQLLLNHGLKVGNTTVTNKALDDIAGMFGGSQRSAVQ